MFLCNCVLFDLLAIILVIVLAVYCYFKYCFKYWKKNDIPFIEPSFPFGSCADFVRGKRNIGEVFKEWYDDMRAKGERYLGFYLFNRPMLILTHVDLVKHVLAKDFTHFYDRGTYCNEEDDPLSAHLFSLTGLKWKNLRNKLSPTFTSGKLKKMFQILVDCSDDLKNCFNDSVDKGEPVDVRVELAKYTTDVIGSCAFGVECNSFQNPNNYFAESGKKVFQASNLDRVKIFITHIYPGIGKFFKMKATNKEVESLYMNLVKDTIDYRKKNNVIKNDFMQLLIQLMGEDGAENNEENKNFDSRLSFNEVVAQAFLFFLAGFETSSSTMTFTLYELALSQNIQDRVRKEIVEVLKKHNGNITYEAIMEMDYLDKIVQESLRMHPPIMILQRICSKDYDLPGTNFTIKQNTPVFTPVFGIHYDPEYYPDPYRFDPDRFTEENRTSRPDYTFLPFGDGPRNCIGSRFGLMQTKVGLCRLLKTYKFSLSSKTQLPLKLVPESSVTAAEGGVWLDVERCAQ